MDNITIGLNIKRARKNKGITQKELAKAINRTESSIRKYEKGLVEIPNSVLEQIAAVLGVNASDLLAWQDIPEIANSVYASNLIILAETISGKVYNYSDKEAKELENKIMLYVDSGNKIENIDERIEYFNNKMVQLTHEMMNHIMEPYSNADISNIVDLVAYYLSFTKSKQGDILELITDLYENKFLRKEYWDNQENN